MSTSPTQVIHNKNTNIRGDIVYCFGGGWGVLCIRGAFEEGLWDRKRRGVVRREDKPKDRSFLDGNAILCNLCWKWLIWGFVVLIGKLMELSRAVLKMQGVPYVYFWLILFVFSLLSALYQLLYYIFFSLLFLLPISFSLSQQDVFAYSDFTFSTNG